MKRPARILFGLMIFALVNLAVGLATFPRYRDRTCTKAAMWVATLIDERGQGPTAVSWYWQLGYIEVTAVTPTGKHYAAMIDRNSWLLLATPLNLWMEPELELRQFW